MISPFICGLLIGDSDRYVTTMVFLGFLSLIGMLLNIWLYYDDIHNRGGILNNVPSTVTEMMQSPTMDRR